MWVQILLHRPRGQTRVMLWGFLNDSLPNVIAQATSAQCYRAAWMGGGFGGEWIHVDGWLSPLDVHLKLFTMFTCNY